MVISANSNTITKVDIATTGSNNFTGYKLNNGETVTVSGKQISVTTDSQEVSIELACAKTVTVASVVITYEAEAGDKELAGLQFPESSYTAILGQAFTAPTLTKATNAAVSYTSSNPEVATVNATTGEVTLVGAGTTTIKAEAPENDTYTAGSAQYTLTVVQSYNTLPNTSLHVATRMTKVTSTSR